VEEYKVVRNGVEEKVETPKAIGLCEICPLLNIVHASSESSQIRWCIMDAALKQAKERYPVCGKDLDIKFASDADKVAESPASGQSVLDTLEKEAESL